MRRFFVVPLAIAFGLALTPTAASAPIGAPITFAPKPGTTLDLDGRGSFHGSLEVRREGGGVTVVNDLTLDGYVAGVREVPGTWPMEALKAQAVAARTYVLWEMQRGYWNRFGFDVCGTTACQVYQGAEAERGERGRRWLRAVHETAGQVLLYQGKPALARYHASSGGHTLNNEVVYPSSGAQPYLRGVDDEPDKASPLHTWTVRFTRAQLELILRTGIGLKGTLSNVDAVNGVRTVHITTLNGALDITGPRFRRVISAKAPLLFPRYFPGPRNDGEKMPMTLPSSRFTITRTGDGFVVRGRGYGHGVGLSQWGAKGRADRGDGYAQILSAYYSGLKPQPWTGRKTIRVAVVRSTDAVRVSGDGAFGVRAGSDTLTPSTLGGWSVAAAGGRSLELSPPPGHRLPLVVTGVSAPSELVVDPPKSGTSLDVGFVVPKPAEIVGVLTRRGEQIASERLVVEAGEQRLRIPLDPGRLGRRDTYRLTLTAFDGTVRVTKATEVVLVRPGSRLIFWAGAAAVLALIALVLYRSRRPSS